MTRPLLLVALCVHSLLLVPLPVRARPDFGINLPITGSAKVTSAVAGANMVLVSVDDNAPYTALADYASLQQLADLMISIATTTVTLGSELVPLTNALVSDVSGDVTAAFQPVFDKITAVEQAIATQLPTVMTSIQALVGNYITDQLTDGFDRISSGLNDLRERLQRLQTAIQAAVTQAGTAADLTDALVKKNVKPTLIYNVVFSVNQLNAYIPEVKYTIDSTLENINLADDYLVLLGSALGQAPANNAQMVASVSAVTDAIATDVKTTLNGYSGDFTNAQSTVAALPQVSAAADYTAVTGALAVYGTEFGKLTTTLFPAMDSQLQALLAAMTQALGSGASTAQGSSALLDSLILTVIENGKFAQFCFNKYLGLVFGFLTSLTDSAGVCFDKEVSRLEFLRDTIPFIYELLPYDYVDIASELTVCDGLTDPAKLQECLVTLSGFYNSLGTNFGLKLQYIFDLIRTELVASEQRFLICIELVKMNLVEMSEPSMMNEIRQCALGGPTADD